MKNSDFFKRRRNIYFTVILITAFLLAGGFWQYSHFIENQKAQLELKENLDAYNKTSEEESLGMNSVRDDMERNTSGQIVTEVASTESAKAQMTKAKDNTSAATETSKKASKDTPVPAFKVDNPKLETMIIPVFGTIYTDFSDKNLVYSKTLELWTTHVGLDIKAEEGSPIRAAMDGTVSEVINDPQWGMTIVLDHGGKVYTRYSNLSTLDMVKVGDSVKKGDVISGLGKTALYESADEPHLHFEIVKSGKNIDPKTYLPKQSLKR